MAFVLLACAVQGPRVRSLRECFRLVIGPSNHPDYLASLPQDAMQRSVEHLDVLSLGDLRAAKEKRRREPVIQTAKEVLQKKLLPDGDITWFDTPDAHEVFQNPTKIRRFFHLVRDLYPDFDTAYATFQNLKPVDLREEKMNAPIMKFLWKLNFRAQVIRRFAYTFDGADTALPSIDVNSLSKLEATIGHTIWGGYDAPRGSRRHHNKFVVFDAPIVVEQRQLLYDALNWKKLRKGYTAGYGLTAKFTKSMPELGWKRKYLKGKYKRTGLPSTFFDHDAQETIYRSDIDSSPDDSDA